MFVEDKNCKEAHIPKNLSMTIAIEEAERMEIFQSMSVEESNNIGNSEEYIHLKEESSDVIIYCLSLANQLDIDLATAIEDKM